MHYIGIQQLTILKSATTQIPILTIITYEGMKTCGNLSTNILLFQVQFSYTSRCPVHYTINQLF